MHARERVIARLRRSIIAARSTIVGGRADAVYSARRKTTRRPAQTNARGRAAAPPRLPPNAPRRRGTTSGKQCAGQGPSAVPIQAERFSTQGENKGKSVWVLARKLFEERMQKARRSF